MRVLRAKQVRKYLRFYRIVFGIKEPYHVILDGNFIHTATKFKIDIRDRICNVLQTQNVKVYILSSILEELKAVGDKAAAAYQFAKNLCEVIDDSSLSGDIPSEKMIQLLGNQKQVMSAKSKERKYIVATLDPDLRSALNSLPGIPLLYLNKVIVVMEPPSQKSKEYNNQTENTKISLTADESAFIDSISEGTKNSSKREAKLVPLSITGTDKVRFKRKAVDANPLSSQPPSEDSHRSKKKKLSKYKK